MAETLGSLRAGRTRDGTMSWRVWLWPQYQASASVSVCGTPCEQLWLLLVRQCAVCAVGARVSPPRWWKRCGAFISPYILIRFAHVSRQGGVCICLLHVHRSVVAHAPVRGVWVGGTRPLDPGMTRQRTERDETSPRQET